MLTSYILHPAGPLVANWPPPRGNQIKFVINQSPTCWAWSQQGGWGELQTDLSQKVQTVFWCIHFRWKKWVVGSPFSMMWSVCRGWHLHHWHARKMTTDSYFLSGYPKSIPESPGFSIEPMFSWSPSTGPESRIEMWLLLHYWMTVCV